MISEDTRHVVVATDENFVLPTATTLRSLTHHGVGGALQIWVLCTGVSLESKTAIQDSVTGPLQISWIDMDNVDLGDTSQSTLGKGTYLRLALGEVLPADVSSVLYMDVDMLVTDSLAPLWELPDGGEVAWAVRSVHYPSLCTYGAMDHWPELGLDPRAPYFNAGLMMIDMRRWREQHIGRKALDHLASPLANGALADQEGLNVALAGRWGELDPKWNQQSPLLEHNRGAQLMYDDDTLVAAREKPAVIHYLSRPKPWHADCTHPLREDWRRVANETAFGPITLQSTPLKHEVKWRVKRAASALLKGR
ncbi:glycosyltransferase family 8 protein [Propioniciclava sinopodophylli]|uniref:glycosyltransferase family 8 protein n=1 Tax=Propioniciclava sinopodophylli TaxID=1837344 RepID=UPI00248FEE06|nr:glycosyltransferase family 8 protein [Propioniciclava sinopodophylli]